MKLLAKLRTLLRRRRFEVEMAEEIQAHLDARIAEHVAAGLSPEEARHAARRQFGGLEQLKEVVREQRSFLWLEQLRQDVQYALRQLWRAKSFTFVVVLTLALGIGATTAIYSVIHTVLFNPVPGANADRIVRIGQNGYARIRGGALSPRPRDLPWTAVHALSDPEGPFEEVAWIDSDGGRGLERRVDGFTTQVFASPVSTNFFRLLGAAPRLGRTFAAGDAVPLRYPDRLPERDAAIVLSHKGWRTLFAGDATVLGRSIELAGNRYTVIGVMPEWFQFPYGNTEFWVAASGLPTAPPGRMAGYTPVVLARLKPGIELSQAQAFLNTRAPQLATDREIAIQMQFAGTKDALSLWMLPLRDTLLGGGGGVGAVEPEKVSQLRHTLFGLLAAIGFVLLIVCANIANLILARTERRQHELAIRAALGAERGRITRQLLTENTLLALFGGAGGLLVTHWGMQLLASLNTLPRLRAVEIDGRVLGATLIVSTLTTLTFGLVPAWRGAKPRLSETLAQGGSGSTTASSGRTYRNALVVVQVALAVTLLTGAGLMIQSVVRMLQVHPGYQTEHLVGAYIDAPTRLRNSATPPAVRQAYYEQLRERFLAIPGVNAVGLWRPALGYEETILPEGASTSVVVYRGANGIGELDGLRVAGAPLLEGRWLEPRDVGAGGGAVLINAAMATSCWPGESAVGKRFRIPQVRQKGDAEFYDVVGVVGDLRQHTYNERLEPGFFRPHQDEPSRIGGMPTQMLVRSALDSGAIIPALRREISQLAPGLSIPNLWVAEQSFYLSTQPQRTYRNYLIALASVGLLLAALGIYGVLAYAVARRTREIGIRIAIGASHRQVLRLVMGEGLRLIALGAIGGLVAAFWLTRLLESRLFGVSPHDPGVALAVLGVLAVVAGIACWLPARRATRIDPMVALRAE